MIRKFPMVEFALYYVLVLSLAFLCAVIFNRLAVPTQASHSRTPVVIVDAGHGGEDGGAASCTGQFESHINLQIALRLHDLLKLLGCDSRLTRNADTALHTEGETIAQRKGSDLRNRVAIINGTPNAILVSIHQNNFPDPRYSGAQVFYHHLGSKHLAESLQEKLNSFVCSGSRRLAQRSKGVYLMEHVSVPAVLVECGFLSHPQEEKKLLSQDYQKKLSCVIAASLCVYLDRSTVD